MSENFNFQPPERGGNTDEYIPIFFCCCCLPIYAFFFFFFKQNELYFFLHKTLWATPLPTKIPLC